jgi:hypothetical protein
MKNNTGQHAWFKVISDVVVIGKIKKGHFEKKNVPSLCAVLRWLNGMKERKPKLQYEKKH